MNQKELKYLTDLREGQKVKVLFKDRDYTKLCTVMGNMPSIEKIELQFFWGSGEEHTRVYKYTEVAKGIIELNKFIPPPPSYKKANSNSSQSDKPQKPLST